jgi:hypothetical protein
MKTPPFLLGAALLFWGWQTGFVLIGALMAVLLEGARWIKVRWEFSEEDFTRIWVFCTLLFLAAAVFAFTANEGPGEYRGFFQNPSPSTSRSASNATARSAAALFRWTPMLFFLFVAAPAYSEREGVPLRTISIILGWRWKRAKKSGQPAPPDRAINISYPYFALCLFAASVHTGEGTSFFWGLCALLTWGLWPLRSPRFTPVTWAAVLLAGLTLGYTGQHGIGRLQSYLSNLNPQWFLGAGRRNTDARESTTQIGMVGRLKLSGKIIMRVDALKGPAPPLLREASYRIFKGRLWDSEIAERDYQPVQADTNGTTFVLVREKTNSAAASIACYLDGGHGVLPLPNGCGRLENLTAFELERNALGTVLVRQGPGLVLFDVWHGPGPGIDSPPNTNDTVVPSRDTAALDKVIAEIGLNQGDCADKLRMLGTFFMDKFTYRLWQPAVRAEDNPRYRFRENDGTGTNAQLTALNTNAPRRRFRQHYLEGNAVGTNFETALTRFLLRDRAGHCEYFATAAVLLLRRAQVPARYAVGYAVHEGSHGHFVVRQRDAHAWCLVWDDRTKAWRDFDPTPPSWVAIESQRSSPLEWLSDAWSRITFEFAKFRWGQTHWRQYLLWALVPMLALLLYQIIFRRRRRRQAETAAPVPVWPGLDSEFYQLERKLAARGLPRLPSEPLSDWVRRMKQEPVADDLRDRLDELLRLHYRYRFDPIGLAPKDREALRQNAQECLARMS